MPTACSSKNSLDLTGASKLQAGGMPIPCWAQARTGAKGGAMAEQLSLLID
jgi:hypothetical protein